VRVTRLAIPFAVLALTVAGCGGGSKVVVKEVPGGSVDLTVSGGDALAPQATATPTASASETPTPDASGTQSSGAATTETQPQATAQPQQPAATATPTPTSANGGATAPDAQATPPPGASKQQFETFCQQNPGAC
jgi:hypothetical protein